MKMYLLAAITVTAVVPAFAQTPPPAPPAPITPYVAPVPPAPPAPPVIERVQTRAEVQAKVAEHFARLDANRDGFVTKAEADAVRSERREQRSERVAERREHRFEQLDTNNDGEISRSEFDAAHAQHGQQMGAHDGGRRGMKAMRKMHMGALHGRMFEMSDANKDGRVSLQEANDAAVRHFDMIDANRDGQVSRDERRQIRRQMILKHRAPKAS
jgi:Ca2+-binding EF-hand superfamily protein